MCFLLGLPHSANASTTATLVRFPNTYGNQIVFEARGNLWIVPKTGGSAKRLTIDPGYDFSPRYSPDGRWIAYIRAYSGKKDVFVISATGGQPLRLTSQANAKMIASWTPDSKMVVFLTNRFAWNDRLNQAYAVPLTGGEPTQLPLDRSGLLSYGPDGHTIAFNRIFTNFATWKRYVGGEAQDIYTYDFISKHLERITDWKGNDTFPMWVGKKIYFVSDRDEHRRANIWVYDLDRHTTQAVTHFADYDVDFPTYGDGEITFQQGDKLWSIDLPSEQVRQVPVVVPESGERTRPRAAQAKNAIREWDSDYDVDYSLSPDGLHTLFSARGDIFSVPVGPGNGHNLTATSGADEDHPAWSPDGQRLAYTTDVIGEQQLVVRSAQGGPETQLTHFSSGYLYTPTWSPRGDEIAIYDGAHRLWLVPLSGGQSRMIAWNRNHYMHEIDEHDVAFSPDGRWLAYSLSRPTRLRALHLYELATGSDTEVSSPMNSDYRPAFSPDGELLYFVSDRHENPVFSDRETNAITLKSGGIYVTTLKKHGVSPFALPVDKVIQDVEAIKTGSIDANDAKTAQAPKTNVTQIDFVGLIDRAVAVPVEPDRIDALEVRQNRLFYHTQVPSFFDGELPGERSALHVFDMITRVDQIVIQDIDTFSLSENGMRVLFNSHGQYMWADAQAGAPHQSELTLAGMQTTVDPRQEWAEMFENAWRLERDLFVNANMNGDDWGAVHDSYARLLPLLGSREDLNFLIGEILGELGSSHARGGGGDVGDQSKPTPHAFLGADFRLDEATGRYQFAHIYPGDNTRDMYRSPLTWPGVNVQQGDFLLAINGRELKTPESPDSLLDGTSGRVSLTVADSPQALRRTVVVTPIMDEVRIRELAYINDTRKKVDVLSNSRIGYIHMADMMSIGMTQFVQQFYPQLEKEALIIDDRWNPGGNTDEIILERLRRVLSSMQTQRDRVPQTQPDQVLSGPKVMLVNHFSSSDGDVFPFHFRSYALGEIIGTRTLGGVRGLRTDWSLLDGGNVVVPEITFYDLGGQWAVENRGVEPDLELEDVPGEFLDDHDIQLETAVQHLMQKIGPTPRSLLKPPPNVPVYAPRGETPASFEPTSNTCAAEKELKAIPHTAVHPRFTGAWAGGRP